MRWKQLTTARSNRESGSIELLRAEQLVTFLDQRVCGSLAHVNEYHDLLCSCAMSAAVGADVEALCSKCGDVWHVVVAKVGDQIVKVHCKSATRTPLQVPHGAPQGRAPAFADDAEAASGRRLRRAVREAGGRRGSVEARAVVSRVRELRGRRARRAPELRPGRRRGFGARQGHRVLREGRRVLVQAKAGATVRARAPEAVRSLEHRRWQAGRSRPEAAPCGCGWLGPAIVAVGLAVGGAGVWYMIHARPDAGDVIDTFQVDPDSQLVSAPRPAAIASFLELDRKGETVWQALIPHYAGAKGRPAIAWNDVAVTVRVERSGKAEVFALGMQDAAKLGGFRLAPDARADHDRRRRARSPSPITSGRTRSSEARTSGTSSSRSSCAPARPCGRRTSATGTSRTRECRCPTSGSSRRVRSVITTC